MSLTEETKRDATHDIEIHNTTCPTLIHSSPDLHQGTVIEYKNQISNLLPFVSPPTPNDWRFSKPWRIIINIYLHKNKYMSKKYHMSLQYIIRDSEAEKGEKKKIRN